MFHGGTQQSVCSISPCPLPHPLPNVINDPKESKRTFICLDSILGYVVLNWPWLLPNTHAWSKGLGCWFGILSQPIETFFFVRPSNEKTAFEQEADSLGEEDNSRVTYRNCDSQLLVTQHPFSEKSKSKLRASGHDISSEYGSLLLNKCQFVVAQVWLCQKNWYHFVSSFTLCKKPLQFSIKLLLVRSVSSSSSCSDRKSTADVVCKCLRSSHNALRCSQLIAHNTALSRCSSFGRHGQRSP